MTYKNLPYFVIILILLVVGFYWFNVRPSQARKQCLAEAREDAVLDTNQPQYYNDNLLERTQLQNRLIEENYLNCVRAKGLEK